MNSVELTPKARKTPRGGIKMPSAMYSNFMISNSLFYVLIFQDYAATEIDI